MSQNLTRRSDFAENGGLRGQTGPCEALTLAFLDKAKKLLLELLAQAKFTIPPI